MLDSQHEDDRLAVLAERLEGVKEDLEEALLTLATLSASGVNTDDARTRISRALDTLHSLEGILG